MAKSIEFDKPFGYVFKDQNWVSRMLLGGIFNLLALVLVGAFVNAGYMKKLFLQLKDNPEAPLPEFEVGKDLAEGLPVIGVMIIYWIPGMILSRLPLVGSLVGALYNLAMLVLMPAVLTRLFVTGRFSAVFEFDQLVGYVKLNLNNLILCGVIGLVSGLLAMVGFIGLVVGVFFTAFLAMLISTRAMADVYRASQDQPTALTPAP